MGSARLLERVLRVREMEEAESRRRLETALSELARMEQSLADAGARERAGRELVNASARSGEVTDRIAGIEESRNARRRAAWLAPRVESAKIAVASLRDGYLEKRARRRQAETLAARQRAQEEAAKLRRGQQALDEWHLNRRRIDGERQ